MAAADAQEVRMPPAAQPVTTSGHPPAGTSPESQERADRLQPLHRRSLLISLPHMRQRGWTGPCPPPPPRRAAGGGAGPRPPPPPPQRAKVFAVPPRVSLSPREPRDAGEDGLWQ